MKQTICEGLGHVRGCRPLRLSVVQLTSLAKHFQERVSDFCTYTCMYVENLVCMNLFLCRQRHW